MPPVIMIFQLRVSWLRVTDYPSYIHPKILTLEMVQNVVVISIPENVGVKERYNRSKWVGKKHELFELDSHLNDRLDF
jgi:hypothetical protein